MSKITPAFLSTTGMLLLLYATNLMAASVQVGNCKALPTFPTIQAAVNAAPAGSTVFVCPGSYPEQIAIGKNLTLRGVINSSADTGSGATIKSPAAGLLPNTTSLSSGNPLAAHVLVHDATVIFTNLTVDSSGNGLGCAPIFLGIFYRNASGLISNSAFLNQIADTSDGCDSGLSIFVQSGGGGRSNVKVFNNAVQNYQRNGITGNEPGTFLTVTGNTVVGRGPTTGAANNGIQIGFGADGDIERNTATDDIWLPDVITEPGNAATGILMFDSSGVIVKGNTVSNTQFGIGVGTDGARRANGNFIVMNHISATRLFDGIDLCGNHNVVLNNVIHGSDESGIHLDSRCSDDSGPTGHGNVVVQNQVNSACAGVLIGTAASPNVIGPNTFFNVGTAVLNGDQCVAPSASVSAQSKLTTTQASETRARFHPARP